MSVPKQSEKSFGSDYYASICQIINIFGLEATRELQKSKYDLFLNHVAEHTREIITLLLNDISKTFQLK